jgi:hypothetical protein
MPDDVIAPLVWDGSTLSIPRARSNQDGYLSRDTFVLLSGGGEIVPVTSFNTRTGEVILLEDDVLAALGYVPQASLGYTPLNKAGDTMTGNLTLAGSPSSGSPVLQAATKAYVDSALSIASSRLPGTYWLTDFKASGSKTKFSGSISSGLTTLTITGTSDFQVGQGIYIAGGAGGSNPLVTKITAIAGTTITLQNAATANVSAVANNVQHDDTVAFQTALDTIMAAGGGTLYVPDGFYRLNGPFTDIQSIIKIPYNDTYPGPTTLKSIAIIGLNQPFPSFSGVPSTKGAVFQTDKIGPAGGYSMIAAAMFDPTVNIPPTSNVTVYMEHLTWRTYQQPQISAVDMGMAGNALFRNVLIDTNTPLQDILLPPAGYFGLRTPRVNTGMAMDTFDNCYILGYGMGAIIAEQFRSTWFSVMRCGIGMMADFNYHPAMHVTGLVWHCPIGIRFNNRMSVDFVLDIETSLSGWDTAVYDFQDSGNYATGWIKYSKVGGGAGDLYSATVDGCANLTLVNLNALGDSFKGAATFKDLTATGTTRINDGAALQPLSVGAASSADSTHRMVRVPN